MSKRQKGNERQRERGAYKVKEIDFKSERQLEKKLFEGEKTTKERERGRERYGESVIIKYNSK